MFTTPAKGLHILIHSTDGHCSHFQQPDDGGLDEMIEYLRRTKVFSQANLAIHADDAMAIFPSHAVSRLDILTRQPIARICAPTWQDTWEIDEETFAKRRAAIQQVPREQRQQLIRNGELSLLMTYELLGGYHVYIESTQHREERGPRDVITSDIGMFIQHAPPPAITISRRDGGLTFLNSANVVRIRRCPGAPERPLNTLMYESEEVTLHP